MMLFATTVLMFSYSQGLRYQSMYSYSVAKPMFMPKEVLAMRLRAMRPPDEPPTKWIPAPMRLRFDGRALEHGGRLYRCQPQLFGKFGLTEGRQRTET